MGVRTRRGPLWASFSAAPGGVRVLLAVPKSVGGAVVRNRARRRIKETLRELVREGSIVLAEGQYLLGATNSLERMSPGDLRESLADVVGRLEPS